MIPKLVALALRQRVLFLVFALALIGWGAYSFFQLPIEAYPDVMDTQVQVISQWPGHAAEEVEQQITVPLETALNTVPHVKAMRSRSLFGLSVLYLTFEDGVDDYFARSQVHESMTNATLPTGVQPNLSPLASATGEIYRYTVEGGESMAMKTLEDWTLEKEFKGVSGVTDVSSFGGMVKQYQVLINPNKLRAYNVNLKQVTDALTAANANSGGSFVELGSEEYVVRGVGLFRSLTDIRNVVVSQTAGTPIRVRDVAEVAIGHQPRLGKVGWRDGESKEDHDDAVEGIVLMRRGDNPDAVLDRIHKKVDELNHGGLPKGVKIHPIIDRSDLVHITTHTVQKNLIEGICLVVAILFLFLANVPAAVITATTIPFGLLFAFSWMNLLHIPANLLSLGAIDFGIIVNGSVILVENVYRKLASRGDRSLTETILAATGEVQSEIFFTTLIIILAYLPLLTMQSVEKKMFSPMAYTIGLALIGSLVMALLVAPPLCYLLMRGRLKVHESRVESWSKAHYGRWVEWCVANPIVSLTIGGAFIAVSAFIAPKLGTEFLPHLDEGNLWIRATGPATISYTEVAAIAPKIREKIAKYQPVRIVVSQIGRPDDGTDATGFYNSEFLADLRPYSEWKGYKDKAELIEKMNRDLSEIPGFSFNFSQAIEDNVEEAVTGVKGELAVKLFGDDLPTLERKAAEIQAVLSRIPGVVDLSTFHETGEPQIIVKVDRDRLARYGLNAQDVDDVVSTAVGGQTVTQFLDGERHFDVVARLAKESRDSLERIREIRLSTADGQRVPLFQVADVSYKRGASFVYREANRRLIAIKFGVRGRDLGGAIAEAQKKVKEQVSLPAGYRTVWGGEFESMQRANARLAVIVPITFAIIFVVLYALFGNVSRPLIVMVNAPLSLSTAIITLYLTGFHLSVSAAVGFISLFGVAIQNGVIMVSYFDHLRKEQGIPFHEAIIDGAKTRLRPVMMTALLASIGLVPAALSTGIGSDVQKPIAIAIIGGMVEGTIGTLFVLPVLYELIERRRIARSNSWESQRNSSME